MSSAAPASTATFGKTLKFLRKRAHLTQRDLGIAVGYSETHITRLENETRLPDPVDRVVAFERRLIAAGDVRAYTVASALPPPSTRPHVTHRGASGGQPAQGGLLAAIKRLFRRR